MASTAVRAKLREKFSVSDVKQRQGAGSMKLDDRLTGHVVQLNGSRERAG